MVAVPKGLARSPWMVAAVLATVPLVAATHETGTCVGEPSHEWWAIQDPTSGRGFWLRNPTTYDPTVPIQGGLLYEESQGMETGLQRGGVGLFGACFPPGGDPDGEGPLPDPCIFVGEDPINSENWCGHALDQIIF